MNLESIRIYQIKKTMDLEIDRLMVFKIKENQVVIKTLIFAIMKNTKRQLS